MSRTNDPMDNSGFSMRGPRSPLRTAATPAPARNPRAVDMPALRRDASAPAARSEGRRLVVGRDITLAGQISKCDVLIVEGAVDGMRYEGQALEILEGGSYSGNVEVESADVSGSLDGNMTVRGRLTIRPSGRVSGNVRYREIEIIAGGQLQGDIQILEEAPAASAATPRTLSPAATFTAAEAASDSLYPATDRMVGE